jgi:hypothetical protein
MKYITALTFRQKCDHLRKDLRSIRFNMDLLRMLRNIEEMVTELGKLEVQCRHHTKTYQLEKPSEKIAQSIDHLEKLILMAKLMD